MTDVALIQEVFALLSELYQTDLSQNISLQDLENDLEGVTDQCLGALHVLLRDETTRNNFVKNDQHNIIELLASYLSKNSINTQRESLGSLAEIVQVLFIIISTFYILFSTEVDLENDYDLHSACSNPINVVLVIVMSIKIGKGA